MADRLVLMGEQGEYWLQWELDDGDDMGLSIGDNGDVTDADLQRRVDEALADENRSVQDRQDDALSEFAHMVALSTMAALPATVFRHGGYGKFYFATKWAANKVLQEAKVLLAERLSNRPWPEWARQAAAAGWKVPKGWQP